MATKKDSRGGPSKKAARSTIWDVAADKVDEVQKRRKHGKAKLAVMWIPDDESQPAVIVAIYSLVNEETIAAVEESANG